MKKLFLTILVGLCSVCVFADLDKLLLTQTDITTTGNTNDSKAVDGIVRTV